MSAQNLNIMIVDDEPELRRLVANILLTNFTGFQINITELNNGRAAITAVREAVYDLVLMDVRMPELDGLTALQSIKEIEPTTFVVIMTAHSNLQDAMTAIRSGAYDYVEKPLEAGKVIEVVQKALKAKAMVSELAASHPILDEDIDTPFVGSTNKMKEIYNLVQRLANVDTTVLIRGENGTGKERVARAIHSNSGHKHGPFVTVNCGAISESLIEAELFGQERSTYPGGTSERKIGKFQLANKGTLFLDEVADLPPDIQVKLDRVLETKRYMPVGANREVKASVRVIATTSRNLESLMEEKKMREDFFYRLNVMPIFLPPLRERIADLPGLAQIFVSQYAKKIGSSVKEISQPAMEILQQYRWPGNIRELENVIERATIIEMSNSIQASSLPDSIVREVKGLPRSQPKTFSGKLDFESFKESAEKEFIENALRINEGKINKTVALANIPKNTLLRKIKKYGIDVSQFIRDTT